MIWPYVSKSDLCFLRILHASLILLKLVYVIGVTLEVPFVLQQYMMHVKTTSLLVISFLFLATNFKGASSVIFLHQMTPVPLVAIPEMMN